MRVLASIIMTLFFVSAQAQNKTAFVSGNVVDENGTAIVKASIVILGKTSGIVTNDSGYFRLKVPAEKSFALVFSHTGYAETQKIFFLSNDEEEKITVQLDRSGKTLTTVTVGDDKERKELGLTKINPKSSLATGRHRT